MVMQKSGLEIALDMAAKRFPGLRLSILSEWAEKLIAEKELNMECGRGDITGETHALFVHNGEVIRLKQIRRGDYVLYHGDWQPDPHWTGD